MQRHVVAGVGGHQGARRVIGVVDRVALRRHRHIGDRLGHRQLAFGAAEALLNVPGIEAQGERARVGVADLLAGHAHHPPGDVERVAAAVEHAREPVQRGVRVGAAHRLVQRADLVVENVAALVEAPHRVAQHLFHQRPIDARLLPVGEVQGDLQHIQQPAGVTVGVAEQQVAGVVLDHRVRQFRLRQGAVEQAVQVGPFQAAQPVHPGPGQQRVVQFEGGVFRGGADEDHRALLHVRQEGVLLGLVETVHLVDEQHRAPALPQPRLGLIDGGADVLDPGQHRRQRDELRVHGAGENQCQGGLAGARRAPQDHRVQLTALAGLAQGFAGAHQVFLADVFVQVGGTQPRRQRLGGGTVVGFEQVVHC